MRLTFRNIFFHGAVIFRGPFPKQGAQLENTCFKRATQNPPGTSNASKVRKPNESWIIWGSATEPQIINFHFNSCKNHKVDSPRLWQKKHNFHYPVKKVCSGISVTNIDWVETVWLDTKESQNNFSYLRSAARSSVAFPPIFEGEMRQETYRRREFKSK